MFNLGHNYRSQEYPADHHDQKVIWIDFLSGH